MATGTIDADMTKLHAAAMQPKVGAVVLSTLSPGTMSSHCAEAFTATVLHDANRRERDRAIVRPGGGTIMVTSGPRIAETRSKIVDNFLTSPAFEGADWLMMIDSDMVFRPENVFDLLEVAHPTERPIVGGLCFAGLSPDTMYPTIYDLTRDDEGRFEVAQRHDYPRDQLVKVGATGAAFMVVHRSVFLQMAHHFATLPNGAPNVYPWFVEGHTDAHGRPFGEDIAFCIRANSLGFPIHVDTRVKIGHHKGLIIDEALYDRTRS